MKEYGLGAELKQRNRNNVYKLVYHSGCVTKQQIVAELGLSLPTVTQNLTELMQEGLICEQGSFGNTGGRRARGYAIVANARTAVGVDINDRRCAVVLVNLRGEVLQKKREYIRFENTDSYYQRVGLMVDEVILAAGVPDETVLGAGIAVQGLVNGEGDRIIYGEILKITGEGLDRIGRYIRYPKMLFHDSDMAAYAEAWMAPQEDMLYLSCSTNLGGAVTEKNTERQDGRFGRARLEHMTLVPDGKRCYCGQSGCADAYCSTTVLTDAVEDGRLESFFERLRSGEERASLVWNDYLDKLSILINNACMMYDCDVVLGGYLGEYMEEYMPELKRRTYRRNSFDRERDYLKLCRARFDPVSVGAALKYVSEFINHI